MHRIVVRRINFNTITRLPDIVWIGYFNKEGMEVRTELLAGRLFPSDLQEGEEIVFMQKRKVEQVEGLAKLGKSLAEVGA